MQSKNPVDENSILEKEASLFAMIVLMPKQLIEVDCKDGIPLTNEIWLTGMAKKYQVPLTAMAARLTCFLKTNR